MSILECLVSISGDAISCLDSSSFSVICGVSSSVYIAEITGRQGMLDRLFQMGNKKRDIQIPLWIRQVWPPLQEVRPPLLLWRMMVLWHLHKGKKWAINYSCLGISSQMP